MKILVTGNMGYIGPVLSEHLRTNYHDVEIIGYDTGFFAHCLTNASKLPEVGVSHQYFGDLRDFPAQLMDGIDGVVHLAAISNDPMGNQFEKVTEDINFKASLRVAELAKEFGVRSYVFASSCSMYGISEGAPRKETDPLTPLTAYARSKAAMEESLASMKLGDMNVTCLRFATACGMSERLRLDLVLNDFVACALTSGEITVLSDGSPWRPLIDVKDMARAIGWALFRNKDNGGQVVSVNVGSDSWNYQVKDLAVAVSENIPGVNVSINKNAPPDKRSYRVDFLLYRQLAPSHQPLMTLQQSISELKRGIEGMGFKDANFRQSDLMRLKMLERHMNEGRLSSNLRWTA
ncbi:MAG: SDR family oxidoreductase [Sulfuricellaceae bacterium]|nr:SDR family oxidoreductase [Sulfuricellaceae bacterium]